MEIERIISFSTLFQRMDFINAYKEGKLDKLVELINNGVNVHEDYGFTLACENGHLKIIKFLMSLNNKPNIHANNEYGFRLACENGHLKIIKYLMSLDDKPNIHAYNENGFRWACENGQLEVIKYLMSLDDKPNIHAQNENGFRIACKNGQLDVIKFLMSLDDKPNIHAVVENGLQSACENEHLEVAKYLSTICDEYELVIDENGKLISWKVNKNWTKELIGKKQEFGVCPICDENRSLYRMKCDERHEMCEKCYIEIRNIGESKCPYCKKEMV